MEYVVAIILGLVQGLTEFLPVSSSGHLALLNLIFGKDIAGGVSYAVFLHVATLIAAFIYFWNDIVGLVICWLPKNKHMRKERRLFWMLVIACLVTGPIGLLLEPQLEFMSDSLLWIAGGFFGTTVVLTVTELITRRQQQGKLANMKWPQAALVGLMQGIAVIPGLSRSGATISGGMLGGLRKDEAMRFAFLVGLPIIMLGAAKDAVHLINGDIALPSFWVSLVGFIIAGVSGYLAISWMLASFRKLPLYWFGIYTAILGCILLGIWLVGG